MVRLKELLRLLEGRLTEHDENRKKVQNKLLDRCSEIKKDADSLEEKISKEIQGGFEEKEEEILGLIEKLNEGEDASSGLIKEAQEVISKEYKYKIQLLKKAKSFVGSYELKVSTVKVEKELNFSDTESIISHLQEHMNKIQESVTAIQEELTGICNKRRKEAEELEKRVNGKLEVVFKAEDARIQCVVKVVKEKIDSEDPEEVKELTRRAQLTLLRKQEYELIEGNSLDNCNLKVEKEASLKFIGFEEGKPTNLILSFTKNGELSLSFTFFSEDEVKVLKDVDSPFKMEAEIWEKDHEEGTSRTLTKDFILGIDEPVCFKTPFIPNTTYCLKMRIAHKGTYTQWSDETEFTTPEFKDICVWKGCPETVDKEKKYSVDRRNPRVALKNGDKFCTIIGNTHLPPNKMTSWCIKILKSKRDGYSIFIGIAPLDINQNEDRNWLKCGWYFDCYRSELYSGPPHNYTKEYGPRKDKGEYVHTGDSVGVVMNTTKGELSFVLNRVNLGVAYEGIPLDKPLVPCVLLYHKGDSVELVF